MAHTYNPSIQEPKRGRFWWVLSRPSWAYRVRFCLKQWHTDRTQESEGSFHFCSPFRFLSHIREHLLSQTVCRRAPRAAVCLTWLCDSLSMAALAVPAACLQAHCISCCLSFLPSFPHPLFFVQKEHLFLTSLFNISDWPGTCVVDRAGFELTGTCLPLPPSAGFRVCATTAQLWHRHQFAICLLIPYNCETSPCSLPS